MVKDIESVLITEQEVKDMVSRLADRINEDYKDKFPVFIGVLKGSFVFMADLIRQIKSAAKLILWLFHHMGTNPYNRCGKDI